MTDNEMRTLLHPDGADGVWPGDEQTTYPLNTPPAVIDALLALDAAVKAAAADGWDPCCLSVWKTGAPKVQATGTVEGRSRRSDTADYTCTFSDAHHDGIDYVGQVLEYRS